MKINFWEIYNKIFVDSSIEDYSSITKLQFIKTIIDKTTSLEELTPLLDSLKTENKNSEYNISLILKSIIAINYQNKEPVLSEQQNLLWLEFIQKISPEFKFSHIKQVFFILSNFVRKTTKDNKNELFNKCGEISRLIYKRALDLEEGEFKKFINDTNISFLIINTYTSDPQQSRSIFEELIENNLFQFDSFLYYCMENVLELDPDYISYIYKYVIGSIEEQEGKLVVTNPIYKADYHSLVNVNKEYFKKQGFKALETLLKSLNFYAISEHNKDIIDENNIIKENSFEKFDLNGKKAQFITDYSHIWGDNGYICYSIYGLITDVFSYISDIKDKKEIDQVIELFTNFAYSADLWRRLLRVISNNPNLYKKYLTELLLNKTFQVSLDTKKVYGKLLKASLSSQLLEEQQIDQIEESIIKLPQYRSDILTFSSLSLTREMLIDLFPDYINLKCSKSKKIKAKNKEHNKDHSAYFESTGGVQMSSRPIGKYEIYEFHGIKISDKEKQLINLFEPLEQFNNNWFNAVPDIDSITKIMPDLINLYSNLKDQINSGDVAVGEVLNNAWVKIAETLSTICKGSNTFQEGQKYKIKKLINECIEIPSKPFDDSDLRKDYLNYRTPANQCVEALVHYYRFINDEDVFNTLKFYAKHTDSSIRNNIAESIFRFTIIIPKFWELLEIIIDNNESIIDKKPIFEIEYWIFSKTLRYLLNDEAESIKILKLIESKYSDIHDKDKKVSLYRRGLDFPIAMLVNLTIDWGNQWAKDKLNLFFEDIDSYSEFYDDIVWAAFRNIRFDDPVNITEEHKKDIENRFCILINKLFKTISENLQKLKEKYKDKDKKEHIISQSISMFFLFVLPRGKNNLEIKEELLLGKQDSSDNLINTLEYIDKILQDENLFHKHPLNLANYVKLNYKILNKDNCIIILDKIHNFSKYIGEMDNNSSNYFIYTQITDEFISFIAEINDKFIEKIKGNRDYLIKFVDIVNKLAETENPNAIKLVWELK